VQSGGSSDGRSVSRGIACIDHAKDGVENLITITGGKLMTYRLMAQEASGLASEKLGLRTKCVTHKRPLPGSEKKPRVKKRLHAFSGIADSVVGSTFFRHGERAFGILKESKNYGLICECEMVTSGEIAYAVQHLGADDLPGLRKRTRIGMGPCQGALCAYRAAGLLAEFKGTSGEETTAMIREFLEERFRGVKPVLWGDALKEMEFTCWLYRDLPQSGTGDGEGA
jgi:glycerol-3-phosphate dehydrogenase